MNVLVIGAGMYVTGRNNSGVGTLLASLAEASKNVSINKVIVAATNFANEKTVGENAARINELLGLNVVVAYKNIIGPPETCIQDLCKENEFGCAILSIPDHLHYEYAKAVIQMGIPCLVVKPLVPTVSEALHLKSLCEKYGVYAAVEFHKRWDATNLWVKRAISENKLGDILYMTVDYSQRISIPKSTFKSWAYKTNIFQYLGVHYVDLIYFLTGFLPVRAAAFGVYGTLKASGIDTWDAITASIVWENPKRPDHKFNSQFSVNWIDPECTSALSDQKYKIIGTKGRIECNQKDRGLEIVSDESGIQQINPYFSEFLPNPDGALCFSGYGFESVKQFLVDVQKISNGERQASHFKEIRPTIEQAIISTAVIEAVNKSLHNNSEWECISNEIN